MLGISRATFGWVFTGLGASIVIFLAAFLRISSAVPVALPSMSVSIFSWNSGYVIAQGTWTIDDDRQAFPLQTSKIICDRDRRTCTNTQAEISFGDTLWLEVFHYDIVKWDDSTLIFKSDHRCLEYIYTISRANERVIGTRINKRQTDQEIAECLAFNNRPLHLTLKDGGVVTRGIINEEWNKMSTYIWVALGLLWAFIIYKSMRKQSSRPQPASAG